MQKQKSDDDSEGEEEESKEPAESDASEPQATMISTGGPADSDEPTAATMDDPSAEMGEIDSILDESYSKAVSDRQKQGLNASRL